jgi:hypothetical protein
MLPTVEVVLDLEAPLRAQEVEVVLRVDQEQTVWVVEVDVAVPIMQVLVVAMVALVLLSYPILSERLILRREASQPILRST